MTCRGGALATSAVSRELTLISNNPYFLHNPDTFPMIWISYKPDFQYNPDIAAIIRSPDNPDSVLINRIFLHD
jgi:hypothetical protein